MPHCPISKFHREANVEASEHVLQPKSVSSVFKSLFSKYSKPFFLTRLAGVRINH